MSRKIATLSLGILSLVVLFAFSTSASATMTQDTLVLKPNLDTSAHLDTQSLIDVASDSSGRTYVLHIHGENKRDSHIYLTQFDKDGNFVRIVPVRDTLPGGFVSQTRIRKAALAVNRTSGAIYVAIASDSLLALFTDTDAASTDASSSTQERFSVTTVGSYRLLNMSETFGFVDVAVWGGTASDSVFVLAPRDTQSETVSSPRDSGIMLWRFTSTGALNGNETYSLYTRLDSAGGTTSGTADSLPLGPSSIALNAKMVAIDTNALGILLQGVVNYYHFEIGSAADSEADTGLFYDTVQILPNGALSRDTGATHMDRIYGNDTWNALSPNVRGFDLIFDRANSRVVIYYKAGLASTAKLNRATTTPFGGYSSSNDADVGGAEIVTNDSKVLAISVAISGDKMEHVALLSQAIGGKKVFYIKRDPATATQIDFDTPFALVADAYGDTRVLITVTNSGSPRVITSVTIAGERYIVSSKPQSIAVTSTGVQVQASQSVTTVSATSTTTFTTKPTISDSTANFTQLAVNSLPATSSKTSAALTSSSSFDSPTYSIQVPLTGPSGDTVGLDLNSTISGVAVYMRQFDDTNPTGGLGNSGTNLDTSKFSALSDTMFTVCAATLVKIRLGDTAGRVYEDSGFADTIAVRIKFTLTRSYLNSLRLAGIDSSNLTVWAMKAGDNFFTQIGNSSGYTAAQLHGEGSFTLVSNTMTSFSPVGVFNGTGGSEGSSGGGVCVYTKQFSGKSWMASTLRSVRDMLLSSKVGRTLANAYYSLN